MWTGNAQCVVWKLQPYCTSMFFNLLDAELHSCWRCWVVCRVSWWFLQQQCHSLLSCFPNLTFSKFKSLHILDQIFMLFLYENKKTNKQQQQKTTHFLINFSSQLHLRQIKASNFTANGKQSHTRWETEESIQAVTSIQEYYFICGFSFPQLFYFDHSTFPFIISSTQFSSDFAHKKQLRIRETMKQHEDLIKQIKKFLS